MLAMGDELARTQRGNNNAYAQDNPLTWLDWTRADRDLAAFVAALIGERRRHRALRTDRWLAGVPEDDSGIPDVEWYRPDGQAMAPADWTSATNRTLVASLHAPAREGTPSDRVLVAIHGGNDEIALTLPEPRSGCAWQCTVDTAWPPPAIGAQLPLADATMTLAPRSVRLLVEAQDRGARPRRTGIDAGVLDRLAAAAGIVPEWWDVMGRRHAVGPDTRRALLAAMGHAVATTDDARARLVELATRRERRRLPATIVTVVGHPLRLPVALGRERTRMPRVVRLTREDGTVVAQSLELDALAEDTVTAADGRIVQRRIVTLPALPTGVHTVACDDDPATQCHVVVAPERCHVPPALAAGGRRFGLAAHLYALRRRGDQGVGDFTTLAITAESTARAGGAVVGLNPLHALFPEDRARASPYHPSDRRFVDPIYIDVTQVPDLPAAPAALAVLDANAARLAALSARGNVDYAGVWTIKHAVLDACFATFEHRGAGDPLVAEFERFVHASGPALQTFARFGALAEMHADARWPHWPAQYARPDAPGVAAFARDHARAIRCACYLQWVADRALAAAAARGRASGLSLGLYRDLAVGAAPDGAEAWGNADLLARGVSIGAPPDPFSTAGQVWCLPPPIPDAFAQRGYAAFRELLAANMRHAGALRIDHAMGLARLFWVPDGASAAEGAYVRYPLDDLLGALALESARARCLVVGEDLGTVPEGFRERLAAADVLSYRVLWFERDGVDFLPPSAWPAKAAACVSTHDLPTIAGWWKGADLDEKQALGRLAADVAAEAREARHIERQALVNAVQAAGVDVPAPLDPERLEPEGVAAAVHCFIGATPAALVLVQADDLAGETAAMNLPDTDRERVNWRRKVGVAADALWTTEVGARARADLAAAGRAEPDSEPAQDNVALALHGVVAIPPR